jgi:hypothetical protein
VDGVVALAVVVVVVLVLDEKACIARLVLLCVLRVAAVEVEGLRVVVVIGVTAAP